MKIKAIIILILASLAAAPAAARTQPDRLNSLTMSYWMTDYNKSTEGLSESSDPDFVPELSAIINVDPRLFLDARYQASNKDTTYPNTNGEADKLTRIVLGGIYDFPSGAYAGLAYHEIKNRQSDTAGNTMTYKLTGARLCAGIRETDWPASHWTFIGELGLGIANNAKVSAAGSSAPGTKGKEFDLETTFSYDFERAGLSASAGYRYIKFKSDSIDTVPRIPAINHVVRGPFFGLSYNY